MICSLPEVKCNAPKGIYILAWLGLPMMMLASGSGCSKTEEFDLTKAFAFQDLYNEEELAT